MKQKITAWIREQLRKSAAKGIVIGLSGGLDSALAAALAKEAVGKNKLLALFLPCHSPKQDLEDVRLISRKLAIKTKVIDLSKTYDNLLKILPEAGKLTCANLRVRLRMLFLYYFANKFNYLVCGTSNKSEFMAGYFTKYGDGASDIMPLGDLFKTQAVKLARYLKIPERIIAKPPTAGLWPGQTDEAEMGITYADLDDILGRLEKRRKQVLPRNKVNKVKEMIARSEHKRQRPKVCYI